MQHSGEPAGWIEEANAKSKSLIRNGRARRMRNA